MTNGLLQESGSSWYGQESSGQILQEDFNGSKPDWYYNFESQNISDNISVASTPGVSQVNGAGGKTIVATPFATYHGAKAASFDGATGANITWAMFPAFGDQHTGSLYLEPIAMPATVNAFVAFRDTVAGTVFCQMTNSGTGKFRLACTGATAVLSTMNYSLSTLYRVDWQFNFRKYEGKMDITMRLFTGANIEGTTADETFTLNGTAVTATIVSAYNGTGIGVNVASHSVIYDSIRVWRGLAGWPNPISMGT